MENQEYNQRNNKLFEELAKYSKDSKEYQEIVAEITQNNVRLVTHVAKRYFRFIKKSNMLSSDDLISEGYIGLLNAIKSFTLEKGVHFASYAVPCIKNKIFNHLKQERGLKTCSLQDTQYGDKQPLENTLASPVNVEIDFAEKDETDRQMAWIRENLDQLAPLPKKVFIAKYLSGESKLASVALAKEYDCTRQNISDAEKRAIKKLRKMYYESHPEEIEPKEEEIELTREEKIEAKQVLKDLILTQLAPQQKKSMLCKFYSTGEKTNKQVAQEINLTEANVRGRIRTATQKLSTLYNGFQNQKQLTSKAINDILQFQIEENGKEL